MSWAILDTSIHHYYTVIAVPRTGYTDRVWNHVQPRSPLLRLSSAARLREGARGGVRRLLAQRRLPSSAHTLLGGVREAMRCCTAVLCCLSLFLRLGAVERTGKKDKLLTRMSRKAPLGPDRDLVLHFLEKKKKGSG